MKKSFIFAIIFSFNTSYTATSPQIAAPDFLILGVTKCGTTSLYDYLIQHPNIASARKKELHFFDTNKFKQGINLYNSYFPSIKEKLTKNIITGEASPGYFWKKQCAKRIATHCPHVKLIIITRNPVSRAISHYNYFEKKRWPQKSFEEAIKIPSMREQIIEAGCYIEHLSRWLSLFPKEQILILVLEELAKSPEQEVNKAFKFLGLKEYTLDSYAVENQGKHSAIPVLSETITMLKKFYEPYNKELEAFLGRKLPWDKK